PTGPRGESPPTPDIGGREFERRRRPAFGLSRFLWRRLKMLIRVAACERCPIVRTSPLYSCPFACQFSGETTVSSAAKVNTPWTPRRTSRLGLGAPDTRQQVRGDHEFCRHR